MRGGCTPLNEVLPGQLVQDLGAIGLVEVGAGHELHDDGRLARVVPEQGRRSILRRQRQRKEDR